MPYLIHLRRRVADLVVLLAALSCVSAAADDHVAPPADHHVHVWSEGAVDLFRNMQAKTGEVVIPPDDLKPLGAEQVVEALDAAGVEKGVLLSTAYFFGSPMAEVQDEHQKVLEENDFVAREVAKYPGRLVGFFSFNPLASYAFEEMDRLAGVPEFAGLKLHLANSRVDLRDPQQVKRLHDIFARTNERDMPIVIHLFTAQPDYGREDVEIFIDEVLPAAPDVPVQIAHFGGGGGFGPATMGAVDAFAAALDDHPGRMENVFFDLSGIPHPHYLAQGREALIERIEVVNQRFLDAVSRLGADRIVYATDWPVVEMAPYLEGIESDLPMTAAEFADLVDDPAPYLKSGGSGN